MAEKKKKDQTDKATEKSAEKTADKAAENTAGSACQADGAASETDSELCRVKDELEKIQSELDKTQGELDSAKDMLMRTAAEYDNFKKRTEKEKAQISDFVKASVMKSLLPVADNIGRSAMCDSSSPEYQKGLEIIVKQLCETLDKLGLKEIEAEGQTFDPNLHEAVMHIEDDSLGENVVAQVLQPGYKLGDTVLRPSMVKVAN